MFRLLTLTLLVFGQIFQYGQSWNLTEYARFVEELSVNARFRDEFEKRTAELFKDPEYENGPKPPPFPCTTEGMKSATVPTSVHALLPGDIQCVAAMGDSLTAAMGAKAKTVVGVLGENRGISWSIGGDKNYNDVLTLPNILRLYNPSLKGYSTKTSISIFNGQNAKHNGLNVAKSGARSYHMREQAELLIERIKSGKWCNWENDWKLVTFFIGGNDLCSFCDDLGKHNPIQFTSYVKEALDTLYNANLPRTLINVVLVLDVRSVRELNAGGFVCEMLHTAVCNCAAFPTGDDEVILNQWVSDYQGNVTQLIKSGIYDKRDDFTVVVQPFFSHTVLPRTGNNVDFSYFAPDCFHFSAKGHAASALSLWNNMFEPVGTKQDAWHLDEGFKCPPADHPYIFTSKN